MYFKSVRDSFFLNVTKPIQRSGHRLQLGNGNGNGNLNFLYVFRIWRNFETIPSKYFSNMVHGFFLTRLRFLRDLQNSNYQILEI
jgi:hypothetical protein